MARKKKTATAEEATKPEEVKVSPQPKTVRCPLRGHKHDLPLVPHPDRPDLLLARCGDREVYQTPAIATARPLDQTLSKFHYVLPPYNEKE